MAVGDIVDCNNLATAQATATLLAANPTAIATLGDNVYPTGSADQFATCYDSTWGRYKDHTRPAIGNHEYMTDHAAPYFQYFGAAAGDSQEGYYSYDIGNWHLIALNSNCAQVRCAQGSRQEQWLRADLAAHPAQCTLAYWHHPRFSSGVHGNDIAVEAFWQDLYAAGADVVLVGHDHHYERFALQDPNGQADPAHGIRQFIVGTGGGEHYAVHKKPLATSETIDQGAFGVLKLTLHPTSYDWQFLPVTGQSYTDSGNTACHGHRAPEQGPLATALPHTQLFSDTFESGELSQWSSEQGLTLQQHTSYSGRSAVQAKSTGAAAYAIKELGADEADLYYRVRFKVLHKGSDTLFLQRFRTATDKSLLGLYIDKQGKLALRNDVANTTTTSTTSVSSEEWHEVQVHVHIGDQASQVEVWFDDDPVDALSKTMPLGTTPVGAIQLGENATGKTFDIIFDDVMVDTQFINE